MVNGQQWVSFGLAGETYVHLVGQVREVIRYSEPVPVPGSPADVEGILSVRGEVVPVLSGRALVAQTGTEDAVSADSWRIIIFETRGGQFGLSVDSVGDILSFQEDQVSWQESSSALVRGTVQHQGKLLIVAALSDFETELLGAQ